MIINKREKFIKFWNSKLSQSLIRKICHKITKITNSTVKLLK